MGKEGFFKAGNNYATVTKGIKKYPAPRSLLDMRYVWNNDDTSKDTPSQKRFRELLAKSPDSFAKQMNGMEVTHRKQLADEAATRQRQKEKRKSSAGGRADMGADRVLTMIDRLVVGWKEGADDAGSPPEESASGQP